MYEYYPNIKTAGLVHFWPIWGNTYDIIGKANMTSNGINVKLTSDRFNNPMSAINLSNGGYYSLPNGTYFSGDFTVCVWIKVYKFDIYSRIFDFGNGIRGDNIFLSYSSQFYGKPALGIGINNMTQEWFVSTQKLRLSEWEHVSIVLSGHNQMFYINGDLTNYKSSNFVPRNITRTSNLIGKSNWQTDGQSNLDIDELKIFNKALSIHEIKEEMNFNFITYLKRLN